MLAYYQRYFTKLDYRILSMFGITLSGGCITAAFHATFHYSVSPPAPFHAAFHNGVSHRAACHLVLA